MDYESQTVMSDALESIEILNLLSQASRGQLTQLHASHHHIHMDTMQMKLFRAPKVCTYKT
jgi:hypothetical protein